MSDQNAQVLKDGSATLAISMGAGTWISKTFELIGVNAAAIGAICSVLSLMAYLYFQYQASKKTDKSIVNSDLIKELQDQIKTISQRKEDNQ